MSRRRYRFHPRTFFLSLLAGMLIMTFIRAPKPAINLSVVPGNLQVFFPVSDDSAIVCARFRDWKKCGIRTVSFITLSDDAKTTESHAIIWSPTVVRRVPTPREYYQAVVDTMKDQYLHD